MNPNELYDFVQNAPMALHWVDSNGIIVWANTAELEFLGYAYDEYVGRSITEFHADGDVIADILARLTRGETLQDYEARLLTKAGDIKQVVICSNVYRKDGKFVHTRCFTRDVTEKKKIEERLRLREAQANVARVAAEVTSQAKDDFLATLSHELRNPLMPILTALEIMKPKLGDAALKERDIIKRQAEFLARMVDSLLDVSRISRGKVELNRSEVYLAHVLERAIELALPMIEQKSHRLDVAVAPGLRVDGDQDRLIQVFNNLLTNAARYTNPDGLIEVRAVQVGGEVVVSVRDTGKGMSADFLPHIFESFVQAEKSSARGGLGLGLAIVQNLVLLHGGTVEAHSDGPGRGSKFSVRLPAIPHVERSGQSA